MKDPIQNRHDLIILFDVVNGNPNGDPDAGNMPRTEPNTQRGLVTDVCLKRKIRNYTLLTKSGEPGYDILIKQGNIIEAVQRDIAASVAIHAGKAKLTKEETTLRNRDLVCSTYFDTRAFGQVISTGKDTPLAGSHLGQIRGPVQVSFARSFHPIVVGDHTITRGVSTKLAKEKQPKKGAKPAVDENGEAAPPEMEDQKERTMGQKYAIPYALYSATISIDPVYAGGATGTGFSPDDYEYLIEVLSNLFEHDQSAARPSMTVRGLLDFEHVGSGKNKDRQALLGCAPRQRLLEKLSVISTTDIPESFDDYEVTIDFDESGIDERFPGVILTRHVDPTTWAKTNSLAYVGL